MIRALHPFVHVRGAAALIRALHPFVHVRGAAALIRALHPFVHVRGAAALIRALVALSFCLAGTVSAAVSVTVAGPGGEARPGLANAIASSLVATGTPVVATSDRDGCEAPCERLAVTVQADGAVVLSVSAARGARGTKLLAPIQAASMLEVARAIAVESAELLRRTKATAERLRVAARAGAAPPLFAAARTGSPFAVRAAQAAVLPHSWFAPRGGIPPDPRSAAHDELPPADVAARNDLEADTKEPVEAAAAVAATPVAGAAETTAWLSAGARLTAVSFPTAGLLSFGSAMQLRAELTPAIDLRLSAGATLPALDDRAPVRTRFRMVNGSAAVGLRLGQLPLWAKAGAEVVGLSVDRPGPELDSSEIQTAGALAGLEARLRFARATAVVGLDGRWYPFAARAEIDERAAFVLPSFGVHLFAGFDADIF